MQANIVRTWGLYITTLAIPKLHILLFNLHAALKTHKWVHVHTVHRRSKILKASKILKQADYDILYIPLSSASME